MTPKRAALSLALCLLAALCAPAARAQTVAADNLGASYGFSIFGYAWYIGFAGDTTNGRYTNETTGQEFTALAGGIVTTLTATVDRFQPEGVPLRVSLFEAEGGRPTTLLGSALFAPEQVSSNLSAALSVFDLSAAHIQLTAGRSYFAEFWVATPIEGSVRYRAPLLEPNSNAFGVPAIYSKNGGATWNSSPIPNEIGLTVRVRPVPGPSALSLFAVAGASGAGLLRRRGSRV